MAARFECRNRAALEGVRLSSAVHAGSYRAAQLVYGNQVARSRSSTDDILVPAALSLSLFSVVDAIKFEHHVRCKIVALVATVGFILVCLHVRLYSRVAHAFPE